MIYPELSRTERDDGTTLVTVALGSDRQGNLVVPTHIVDGPGYQDMLNQYAEKQAVWVNLRDGGAPS
jgi:hypothetical protein